MQNTDQTADVQEPGAESPPPSTEEGYLITITVTKDGYEVDGPELLPAEPQGEDQGEHEEPSYLPDLTTAIKHMLAIVKENPVSQDEQSSFKGATSDMGKV